ncbi:hypothetical protein MNV49_003260 [Pseudohyphozyma bogoriensis]|nr:hypothetical protein MNV49_003260 [Pseudohyphozyma bogoriensis]
MNASAAPSNASAEILRSLQERLYLHASPSYPIHLDVAAGGLGVSLFLVLVALAVRVRRPGFWVVRFQPSPFGMWIVPHPVVCWLMLAAVFLAVAQPYVESERRWGHVDSDLNNTMVWRLTVWLPLYYIGWILAWGIAISPCTSTPPVVDERFDASRWPTTFNVVFLAIPILVTAIVLPLSIVSNSAYNQMYEGYATVRPWLENSVDVGTFDASIQSIYAHKDKAIRWMRWAWITWCAAVCVLGIVRHSILRFYFFNLRSQMHDVGANPSTSLSNVARFQTLKWAYRALLTNAILICTVICGFFGFTSRGGVMAEVLVLMSIYLIGILSVSLQESSADRHEFPPVALRMKTLL